MPLMQPIEKTDEILRRLELGEGLATICRSEGFPSRQAFLRRVETDPELADRYARARGDGIECLADQILSIADDSSEDYITRHRENGSEYTTVDQEHVNRSRLRVDSRKWLLSKLRPDKYGDAIKVEHSGQVDLAGEIRKRRQEREKE